MTDEIKKLKSKDVPTVRRELLEAQSGNCALCGLPIVDDPVLDHDHKGGHVRAVLHRGCNAVEGKIVNSLRRYGIKNPSEFLKNLVQYHAIHSENNTGLIHPTHKTEEEKKELAKKRLKRKQKLKAAERAAKTR